jgi:hypothetical protein
MVECLQGRFHNKSEINIEAMKIAHSNLPLITSV